MLSVRAVVWSVLVEPLWTGATWATCLPPRPACEPLTLPGVTTILTVRRAVPGDTGPANAASNKHGTVAVDVPAATATAATTAIATITTITVTLTVTLPLLLLLLSLCCYCCCYSALWGGYLFFVFNELLLQFTRPPKKTKQ